MQSSLKPLVQLVGDFALQVAAFGPLLQHLLKIGQLEEVVLRLLVDGFGARDGRDRILQLTGGVAGATSLAVVTILVISATFGAFTFDEAIWQKHLLHRVEGLGDGAEGDVVLLQVALVDDGCQLPVLIGMGGVVVIKIYTKTGEVLLMLGAGACNQLLGCDPFLACAQHDGGAVGVIGADVEALVPAHLLKSYPDIGLHILNQMADMDGAIGVGQGAGDQDLSHFVVHCVGQGEV